MSIETRKSKIPAVRLASDDCAIMQGRVIRDGAIIQLGTPVYVHQGEWVEIVPVSSMRELLALSSLIGATQDMTQQAQKASQLFGSLSDLCEALSRRVLAWNWTDMMGDPLPQPYRDPLAIQMLSEDELLWLLTAVQGETAGQRKNGFTP